MLKAAVKEGDKNREVLARQMTQAIKQEMQLSNQQYTMSNYHTDDRRERQRSNERQLGARGADLQIQPDDSYGQKSSGRPAAPHSKDLQRSSESLQQRTHKQTSAERKEEAADKALWVKVDGIFAKYDKNGDGKIKVGKLPKDLRDID